MPRSKGKTRGGFSARRCSERASFCTAIEVIGDESSFTTADASRRGYRFRKHGFAVAPPPGPGASRANLPIARPAAEETAFPAQGKVGHLSLHGRRTEHHRHVRSQTDIEKVRWSG